ncbi:hypothetical protein BS50DRAFT_584387 [Corynespora cassiicola Philippines]|uniref:Uncharacterized protein n=1 Tax=Corynespora cassiicola Philippines TaxID=1448308 RepID=A0A2T2NZH1_CORCC|nr:hypothetical protein BS50DRAFT_584387 [Corynespora cassiicola Philippines]
MNSRPGQTKDCSRFRLVKVDDGHPRGIVAPKPINDKVSWVPIHVEPRQEIQLENHQQLQLPPTLHPLNPDTILLKDGQNMPDLNAWIPIEYYSENNLLSWKLLWALRSGRFGQPQEVLNLLNTILIFSRRFWYQAMADEPGSGLRYWAIRSTGGYDLFKEWLELFRLEPRYLQHAPLSVKLVGQTFSGDPDTLPSMKIMMDVVDQAVANVLSSNPTAVATGTPEEVGVRQGPRAVAPPSRKRQLTNCEEDNSNDINENLVSDYDADCEAELGLSTCTTESSAVETPETPPNEETSSPEVAQAVQDFRQKRGKILYSWPLGRHKVFREILHRRNEDLPDMVYWGRSCELESRCTPCNVDITLAGSHPMSAEEILTYFPLHTSWREVLLRLIKSWTAVEIVRFIVYVYDLKDRDTLDRSRLQHAMSRAKNWFSSNLEYYQPISSMKWIAKSNGNVGYDRELTDYFLFDMADFVKVHPTGRGAQVLTKAIQHARQNNNQSIRLSQLEAYVAEHKLADLVEPLGDTELADEAAKLRWRDVACISYKRKFPNRCNRW